MSHLMKRYLRATTVALMVITLSLTLMPATHSAAQAGSSMNGHAVSADFLAYWNAHGGLAINGLPITDEHPEVSLTNGQSYATQWFERARYERHPENSDPQYKVLLGLLGTNQAEGRTFDVATDQTNTPTHMYFADTKHSLTDTPGPFLTYWKSNGGLAQFGFPLSEQIQEVSTDGKTYDVQYFQRQRFEFHPEQAQAQYKVLLGLLGVQQYKQQYVAQADVTSGIANNHSSITVGMSQEPDTLFSPNAQAYVSAVVLAAIENGLVGIDNQANFYPDLAAYIPSLDNGAAQFIGADGPDQYLQVKWKLRHGVKWSDGTEFTAKDVVYGWQGIFENPNVQVVDRTAADEIASFTAVDDYTVVAKYLSENQAKALFAKDKDRYGQYQNQIGPVVNPLFPTNNFVFPEHADGKLDATKLQTSDYGRAPIGTGPYRVRQWIAGQAVILEKNPYYSLSPNKPSFDTITFKIVEDTNQLLAQVQTGQIQVVTEDATSISQIPQLDQIAQSGSETPHYIPSTTWEHVDFNLSNPLFQDVNVRHAIAYAINRQQIVDKVLFGKTVVAHTWITPSISQYFASDVPKYEYNPDKARQLLAAAGYTAGSDGILTGPGGKMSFQYMTTAGNAYRQAVTQLVAADLKAVGIDAQLTYVPSKQFFAPDGPLTRRTFAFAEYAWISAPDPGGISLYSTGSIPSAANGYTGQNNPGYSNPENDKLLNEANNDKLIALDPAKRAAVYKQEQKIWATDLPVIPLHVRLNISVAPTSMKNYKPSGSSVPPTWNIQDWRW